MKRISTKSILLSLTLICALGLIISCENEKKEMKEEAAMTPEQMVARGKYLATVGSCNDCHSPKVMTAMGPVPDTTKLLSGHPAGSPPPPLDTNALHPGYGYTMTPDITGFMGPWGISYAANLSPDSATGIGAWTVENFMGALRTGKHLGMQGGRPIAPPMPWPFVGQMTDDDLKSVFAYLKSLPAISNEVPSPIPPPDAMAMATAKK